MNENLTPPRESDSDAFFVAPDDVRVLAPSDNAPRADDAAPFREASAEQFRTEPFSPSAASGESAAPIFSAATPDENVARDEAPVFQAAAPSDFATSGVTDFADARNADARNAMMEETPQNADAPRENVAPPHAAASSNAPAHAVFAVAQDAASPTLPPQDAASDAEENAAPHNASVASPRAEAAASTRSARVGIAALIGKVSPRILTALVGIPLVLLIVWQGGALLTGITVLLALTAMRELIVAARKNKTPLVIEWCYFLLLFSMIALWNTMPLWREIYLTGVTMATPPFVSLLHLAWPLLALLLVPVWLLLWGVICYAKKRVSLSSIALSTLAIFYVALFAFWPMLRDLTNGTALFVLLLGGVWAGDSAAYFAGRALGKTRLTPLSPGKTREGIVASCVATLLMCLLLAGALRLDFRHGAAIGVLIAVFAPLGDLVESLWKRELGVKDLGAILPGHGGVLDRCDSLLLTAPVVFVYALWQAL